MDVFVNSMLARLFLDYQAFRLPPDAAKKEREITNQVGFDILSVLIVE